MMKPILALVWKEVDQSRSIFLLGVVAMAGFAVIGLESRLITDHAVMVGCGFGAVVLVLLTSMGITAPERADGSIAVLRALPMGPAAVMLIKLAVASSMLLVTIVLTGAVTVLMSGGREVSTAVILSLFTSIATTAVVLLAWMTACNVRMRGEGAAGLVSLGVLVLLVSATYWINATSWIGDESAWMVWLPWGAFGEHFNMLSPPGYLETAGPSLITVPVLWLAVAARFARVERSRG